MAVSWPTQTADISLALGSGQIMCSLSLNGPSLTILSGGLSVTVRQWPTGEAVMPLLRVARQLFGALVDHLDGRRGRLCVRGPPECLILQVHRKPLQPWRDRDRRPEDCRESISCVRLSPLSPCATRRNRGNQAPLRSQPQRNRWHSAARLLVREPGSGKRPAVPG